ncbi:hypothetical protein ACF9IK_00840 [Kitasatospora hibisci]|uniref:hypothetical protein n=1 Tax=Kitasatospora hibisci TaxID=3369522 RepID=UPI00375439A1
MLIGVGPWLLRGVRSTAPADGAPAMEYVACAAASAFAPGTALGRVRAWAPRLTAGGVAVPAVPAASGAFGGPAGEFGDTAGLLSAALLLLGPVIHFSLPIGSCIGWLIGSLREGWTGSRGRSPRPTRWTGPTTGVSGRG